MKVKCINAPGHGSIKNGANYIVIEEFERTYRIKDDNGVYADYYKSRFEVVDEVAPELDFQIDEFIVSEDFPIIEKKEEVKGMRTLKERILEKIDYRAIAEQIWNRIEEEVIEKVAYSFDEDSIADDMIRHYKSDYIDVAKEVLIEEFYEDISSDEIEDHIKDIARENVYE